MNPFAQDRADRIDSIGETALIGRIRKWLGHACPPAPFGIGDDCSLLRLSPFETQLLTTADPVIYGSHFDERHSPQQAARKLLRRNLSDIAAMGGVPKIATLSLATPGNLSLAWIESFYGALAEDAVRYETLIVGGDVTATKDYLGLFMTLNGVASERVLERGRASANSPIYVTGTLGGSIRKKHCSFEPRLKEGQWLAGYADTVACMDLSDGLGKDALGLVDGGLGIRLKSDRIPVSADAMELANGDRLKALERAVNDGEDYELLFALSPGADCGAFEALWAENPFAQIARIGYVNELAEGDAPIAFEDQSIRCAFSGYEHFRTTG